MSERENLWRERVHSQVDSGMTVAEFCDTIGVSTASFYQWRKRLQADSSLNDSGVPFVRLTVRESAPPPLVLDLPHAVQVRIPEHTSEERLASILRAALLAAEASSC